MRLREIILRVLPLTIWMGMIYYSSSQPYEQQDLRPLLRKFDLSLVERSFSWVSFTYSNAVISIETKGVAGFIEFFIRKGAHVFVFFTLGLLIFRFLKLFKLRKWLQFLSSLLLIFLFASSDELRHFYNPDRTGLIEDVILDTVAGFLGICFALLVIKGKSKKTYH